MKTKEIAVIEKELNPIVKKATDLVISTPKDMEKANEALSQLRIAQGKVTEKMETITLPAKETIKAAEAIWKPFITSAKNAIQIIRDKMSEYQTVEVERARIEEEKLAARVGEGKGKLKAETAVAKMGEIDTPADKIESASGKTGFREDQQFEVINILAVPSEYIMANEPKIRIAMKAGIKLKGVRYFTKQVPINRI